MPDNTIDESLRTGRHSARPVRFLSDLHLGHDMCRLRRVEELWPLIDGAGTLVLNGDTVEARAEGFRARSQEMREHLEALCRRAGTALVYLNGNHDPESWPHDYLDLAGGALFVTHGHVLLRLVSPWSSKLRQCREELERIHAEYTVADRRNLETRFAITRRCCLAMPPSETRMRGRNLRALLSLVAREIWPPTRPLEVLKVWAQLPALASSFVEEFRPQAKVMLFGHTHRAALWRRNGRLLVNMGGFVTFARPLLAEWRGDSLTVHSLTLRGGEYRTSGVRAQVPLAAPGAA